MLERVELLKVLQTRGVRLTAQRRARVETIQAANQHLDAATLLEQAREHD